MNRKSIILLLVFAALLSACQSATKAQPSVTVEGHEVIVDDGSYTAVSASELQIMLSNKDFTLINVHIPYEGNLPNTDLSIPYDQIDQSLDEFPSDKNAKIVLYCRSGRMSAIAAKTLVSLGYTNIWNLSGGMTAWEQAGLKIDR
jgi:phage shock protein E